MRLGATLSNDVELLLTREVPEDRTLANLVPVVALLRDTYVVTVPEDKVARLGADLARAARQGGDAKVGATPPRPRRTLRRKLVPVLAAAALLAGMTGVAYAVEDSLPGDAFYGLKITFENVGILSGGVEERVSEAQALFASGKIEEALAHAAQAAGTGDPLAVEAALALERAADRLRANEQGSDNAIDVRGQLADRFDWMADTEDTGRDFGQGVAERAPRPAETGSEGSSNANPEDVGNRPEHAGSGGKPDGSDSQGGGSGGPSENPGQGGGKPDKADQDDS